MRICICGGGSLGHVCAGVLGSRDDVELNIYSGHPSLWQKEIEVTDPEGKLFIGHINAVSDNPKDVITNQDIILFCLPGFLIEGTLQRIKPFIGNAKVGTVVSSTGFFFFAHEILGSDAKLFGFQRVPFIARVNEYGKKAKLLGYKSSLAIATENIEDNKKFCLTLAGLFSTPITLLDSFYEVALTNSNPILHTGRLYSMFHGREHDVFDHNILFYKEWTDDASEILIKMDEEFFQLLEILNIHSIPTLLNYYESSDAKSLTRKISSIQAFQSITSPMKQVGCGWIPDFSSRYFTEDFPFGLKWIIGLFRDKGLNAPVAQKVYQWGMNIITNLR